MDAITDYGLMTSLKKLIPEDMETRLEELPGYFTLKEARHYVREQIQKRLRKPSEKKPKTKANLKDDKGGVQKMDVDALNSLSKNQLMAALMKLTSSMNDDQDSWEHEEHDPEEEQEEPVEESEDNDGDVGDQLLNALLGKGKNGKGDGKGKGGKGFQGSCHSCGIRGHTWRECRKFPAGKGKGKSDKGGGKGWNNWNTWNKGKGQDLSWNNYSKTPQSGGNYPTKKGPTYDTNHSPV